MNKNPLLWVIKNYRLLPYCLESFKELIRIKALMLFLPHKYWGFRASCFQCETLRTHLLDLHQEVLTIQRALTLMARYAPWRCKCLEQALAAQRMLAHRHLDNTLYLGMLKDQSNCWVAHAWVRCSDIWVIGYQPTRQYTIVGTYACMK